MKIKGFTIIELLIVISIILLMSGMTFSSFNSQTSDKKLDAEARKLADVMDLAKKKASSGDSSSTCSGQGLSLTGYRVVVTAPSSYLLQLCCDAGVSCGTPSTVASYSIQSSGITFQNSGTPKFKLLSEGADITSLPSGKITVKSNTTKCIDVTVTSLGVIDVGTPYTVGC